MSFKISTSFYSFLSIIYFIGFMIVENGTFFSSTSKIILAFFVFLGLLNYKRVFNSYVLWISCYTIFVVLSIYWASYVDFARQSALTVVYTSICSLIFPILISNDDQEINFIYKLIIVLPIMYFVYYIVNNEVQNFFDLRQNATNQGYNNIGLYAAYSFIFIKIYQFNQGRTSVLYHILIVNDFVLIAISQSRKAIIYVVLFVILSYILESKNILRTLTRLVISTGLIVLLYFFFRSGLAGSLMQNLILSIEGSGTDSSYIGRVNQLDISMRLFNQNRFLGIGIGGIEYVSRFIEGQRAPIVDNDYLDVLADLGLCGFLIYYGFHCYLFRLYFKYKSIWNRKNLMFFVLLVILFIQGFLIRGYFNNYYIPLLLYLIYFDTKQLKIKGIQFKC